MTLFFIGIIVLLLGLFVGLFLRFGTATPNKRRSTLIIIAGTLVCVICVLVSCVAVVPTGHTGVVTTFGKVEDTTLDAGVSYVAPWQRVVNMDNRVQKQTVALMCFSSDIQEVSMSYTVNYQIDKTNAMTIYRTIGTDYYNTVIAPSIAESVKIVAAGYSAEELVGMRSELASAIEADLAAKLAQYNIEISSTSIEDMDFTDAFTNAVEAKQVAQQNKLRAETEAEQTVIEAEAAANVKKVEADAAAYELLTLADAEAEANRKLADSLTDELVAYTYANAWNGELPTFMTSEGGSIPMFDFGSVADEVPALPVD